MESFGKIGKSLFSGVIASLIAAVIWEVIILLRKKCFGRRWLVAQKEDNYFYSEQYDIFILQVLKNTIYPMVLVIFNVMWGVYIAFWEDKVVHRNIYVILPTLLIVIYILLFSIKNKMIRDNDSEILCGRMMVFAIIGGIAIAVIFADTLAEEKWGIYVCFCTCITIIEIVSSECLLKKIGFYRLFRHNKEELFLMINILLMCANAMCLVVLIETKMIEKSSNLMLLVVTIQTLVLFIEFVVNNAFEKVSFEKVICLKNGKKITTESGIRETKKEKIIWEENDGRVKIIKRKNIKKICFFIHYSPRKNEERDSMLITLDDGTEISGFKYRKYSNWCGIYKEEDDGIRVELYPEENVEIMSRQK